MEDVYAFPPERRTLGTLVRSLALEDVAGALALARGGRLGRGTSTTRPTGEDLKLTDWQVIDLAGAAEHEDLCEAALFYLLERMRLALEDPAETARVKLMVVDEAWRYLRDRIRARLSGRGGQDLEEEERRAGPGHAISGGRDRNQWSRGACWSPCPRRLFLANPDLPETRPERRFA